MFQKLVSHNDDFRRLVEKGFAVSFDSGFLIVRDIPYLDAELKLHIGAIVTKLRFIDENRVAQEDHQIFFAGGHPYGADGKPIANLGGGATSLTLSKACEDVVVQRSFSNKPRETGVFLDFFEKIESYVTIISGPAMGLLGAHPYTYRASDEVSLGGVFKFQDTLTSRAEIGDLSAKFEEDIIAIIGLGGTGGYLLDFLVKTPVREIRGFDNDLFYVHNSFRSPGRLMPKEFGLHKSEVYFDRYESFRNGLSITSKFIDSTCADDLRGVTFAFVCVDKGSARAEIFDLLISMKIPFIDVGMGLKRKEDGSLTGMLRTTYYSSENGSEIRDLGLAELSDNPENIYRTNIQIGELNALNASLAIIKFKQLRGFYFTEGPKYHLLFEIGDLKTIGEP